MIHLLFLASSLFVLQVSTQLSAYETWTTDYIRYCEMIQSTNAATPLYRGVACGRDAWNVMSTFFPLRITSTMTLGLINVAYITTTALTDQSGFWNTCKPYMVRLFDGLWSDVTKACTLLVNPPWGFPNCTQDYDGAFVYRSGSGYCMKSKVCGATVEIDFLKSADNSSIIYTWTTTESEALIAQGYTKVGNCYGYSLLPNPAASNANLMNELSFP
ncbi:Protein CBG07093 [Caenorhabditis briggsae]|uniref:Uncharacterized protein n=2 Tax=Caenorhabditis briggsae TaxID=6238 RepID=A0AAE9ECX8_CAEBR|nr:Protein CBG07093 [Caenorhabditis briggsae]UMM20764.1 hypothetical protein L5515_015912 [Caenorhabditis briggsae]CAP27262.1 Protein CBG07093 [Caenorhabditis briggsae]